MNRRPARQGTTPQASPCLPAMEQHIVWVLPMPCPAFGRAHHGAFSVDPWPVLAHDWFSARFRVMIQGPQPTHLARAVGLARRRLNRLFSRARRRHWRRHVAGLGQMRSTLQSGLRSARQIGGPHRAGACNNEHATQRKLCTARSKVQCHYLRRQTATSTRSEPCSVTQLVMQLDQMQRRCCPLHTETT